MSSSGGAADEGLVGELARQEGAAGAIQCGHQQRPGRVSHQLPPTTPGYSGWRRSQHWHRLLPPQGTMIRRQIDLLCPLALMVLVGSSELQVYVFELIFTVLYTEVVLDGVKCVSCLFLFIPRDTTFMCTHAV